MESILRKGIPFTAVLASNDESAIGAIDALRDAGLVVPHDVAVIGFDDRLEAKAHMPPLTTVHHPMFELGYQSVVLLLRRIERPADETGETRIPTQLIVRQSCGCPPGAAAVTAQETASVRAELPRWHTEASESLKQRAGADLQGIKQRIVELMAQTVSAGTQRLSLDELDYLCQRLVEAFILSLEHGDPMTFRLAIEQILQRAASVGDDLHVWQAAMSVLRARTSDFLSMTLCGVDWQQVDDMLHQARVVVSEIAQGQYARRLTHQTTITDRVGRMTARFLAAQDEAEIFDVLAQNLPEVGIHQAVVALYEADGDDPVNRITLRSPGGPEASSLVFPSRQFPPYAVYPSDRPFSLALLPLLVQEKLLGFVAFDGGNLEPCADIVRQLGAALLAARLFREAVEGRRLAEEADRLKSRFLSVVSHELRTPLNLIWGLSDVLLREGEEIDTDKLAVSREDVLRIHVSAQHLDSLIRDVLDLARSEVGQLRLVRELLDLTEVLEAVSTIGEQMARDRGLAWRLEIAENLPRVLGDRTRLRQVVLSLVNNAAKFTATGEIELMAAPVGDRVQVAVRDTGLGVPAEEQQVIFDEFRQSERTTARGYGGLGLGLAICKRLIELHDGEIGVRSSGEDGKGSTFYFTLPAMTPQPMPLEDEVRLGQARQVLLLVKDVASGSILGDYLKKRGFGVNVHQVIETNDWLGWLLASPPEAVVLDLGLASEQGWEILSVLKENPATKDVPVMFCDVKSTADSGSMLAVDYLTKPVGTAELAGALMCQGLLDWDDGERPDKKILIVDDEPAVLKMHARMVEAQSTGYKVLQARNGLEALDVIRCELPDLVLLDLMMPELDGFGVLEAMQTEEVCRNIPVIVVTGQILTEEDVARLNHGVVSVLTKGMFTAEETLARVERVLEHRRELSTQARRFVLSAMAYMHAHCAEPISLGDVARSVGLTERHLDRCFRQEMGLTPITYLNRYRIKQAKLLLATGSKTVTEIAFDVGFSDSSYFARVFRREVGLSPSAYRRGERSAMT